MYANLAGNGQADTVGSLTGLTTDDLTITFILLQMAEHKLQLLVAQVLLV